MELNRMFHYLHDQLIRAETQNMAPGELTERAAQRHASNLTSISTLFFVNYFLINSNRLASEYDGPLQQVQRELHGDR